MYLYSLQINWGEGRGGISFIGQSHGTLEATTQNNEAQNSKTVRLSSLEVMQQKRGTPWL
jgi:hypothetical protein